MTKAQHFWTLRSSTSLSFQILAEWLSASKNALFKISLKRQETFADSRVFDKLRRRFPHFDAGTVGSRFSPKNIQESTVIFRFEEECMKWLIFNIKWQQALQHLDIYMSKSH